MTILITDKDFADAVKNNERIQNKTIYWIGEEPNFSCLGLAPVAFAQTKYEIGKYYPDKGIYAGELKKQDGFYGIFATLQDAGEKDDDEEHASYGMVQCFIHHLLKLRLNMQMESGLCPEIY